MKRFLLSFLKFILPFLLMLVAIELYVLYFPSTFNKKATYLKNNITEITTIILGSSHNQNSLNPEYLHFNTAIRFCIIFLLCKKTNGIKTSNFRIRLLFIRRKN
jgi:uncharacterized membrane protein YcaP (DUF421 family)